MPTGAGWITVGPAIGTVLQRSDVHRRLGGCLMARIQDGAGADRAAPAGEEPPGVGHPGPLAGSDRSYFGDGADSLEANRSEYRLESTNIAAYATVRPAHGCRSADGLAGSIGRRWERRRAPSSAAIRRRRRCSAAIRFCCSRNPASPTGKPRLPSTPATVVAIRRLAGLIEPRSGYTDQDQGAFSFRRSEMEAAHLPRLAREWCSRYTDGWWHPTPRRRRSAVLSRAEPRSHNTSSHESLVSRPQSAGRESGGTDGALQPSRWPSSPMRATSRRMSPT